MSDVSSDYWQAKTAQAIAQNGWFTIENIQKSMCAIASEYLDEAKLTKWVNNYEINDSPAKKIGLVMAGNLPLVGIHDLICSYIAGHHTLIKCSSKDQVLINAVVEQMIAIDSRNEEHITIVDQLKGYDAVIATGGDTAATHFEYYFRKYPHIIRKNRNSVAILTGEETDDDLALLANDIFDYFGLGCRSVSKVYIPRDFEIDRLFRSFVKHQDVIHHNKYKNNFDYNHAIYVLTQQPCLTNDVIILREDEQIASRIACLHYERYDDLDTVMNALEAQRDDIQCLSTKEAIAGWTHIPLGTCQQPGLSDYADNVDTMKFLTTL